MPEPLKNLFNPQIITALADHLSALPDFDRAGLLAAALHDLEALELKQRSAQITAALTANFHGTFEANVAGILSRLHPETARDISEQATDDTGLAAWIIMPLADYVAEHGLDKPEFSLAALRELTMRSTAEFAIRPFFRDHRDMTLKTVRGWIDDPNEHVRRLVSEGSRPRLPWGLQLKTFVNDPAPLLPLLKALRDDPSEYVRRSVANNLNDISKDHPDLVAELAADWLRGAAPARTKLVKHACRGLIKAGHPGALAAFGYGRAEDVAAELTVSPHAIVLGDSLDITAKLTSPHDTQVLVDLILGFLKADGRHARKVFKWTETALAGGTPLTLTKRLPLRPVTTRRHYSGTQVLALQVNGQDISQTSFELDVP